MPLHNPSIELKVGAKEQVYLRVSLAPASWVQSAATIFSSVLLHTIA